MGDWMICLDEGGNADGPVFEGPRDEPVWSLYADQRHQGGVRAKSGPHFGEWQMYRYTDGLTYDRAVDLAQQIGLAGAPIGG